METRNNSSLKEMFFSADGSTPVVRATAIPRSIGAMDPLSPELLKKLEAATNAPVSAVKSAESTTSQPAKVEEKALFENFAHQYRMIIGTILILMILSTAAFFIFARNKPEQE